MPERTIAQRCGSACYRRAGTHVGTGSTTLTLDLIRAANAGDPYEFVFAPQSYLLRNEGTCKELQRVGDTLDFALKVIDEE